MKPEEMRWAYQQAHVDVAAATAVSGFGVLAGWVTIGSRRWSHNALQLWDEGWSWPVVALVLHGLALVGLAVTRWSGSGGGLAALLAATAATAGLVLMAISFADVLATEEGLRTILPDLRVQLGAIVQVPAGAAVLVRSGSLVSVDLLARAAKLDVSSRSS